MSSISEIKFGTDGWRGIIAWDFSFENVRKTAQAIADHVRSISPAPVEVQRPAVIVGYDTRFLSEQFATNIAQILRSNKIEAMLCAEPVPTPLISLLTSKKFVLGVMVTASHNPFYYNGIKIKAGGHSASDAVTQEVESYLGKSAPLMIYSMPVVKKSYRSEYLAYLKARVNPQKIAAKLKHPVVVDYMYGASCGILEELLKTKKIAPLHSVPNPLFPGLNPEPVEANLKELAAAVRDSKACAGIALDGDGDRIGALDEKGNYITPCQLFPLFADYLITQKKLKGKIVQCVSLGYLAKKVAAAHSLDFEEIPVGFKYIAEKMANEDILIGAEESGGYSWKGNLPERDGALSALLLMEIMTTSGKKLSELVRELEHKYGKSVFLRKDFKIAKAVADKKVFAERLKKKLPKKVLGCAVENCITIDGLKIVLAGGHWVLIRPSGTEPLLRIYAESDSKERTEAMIDYAAKLAASHLQ